MCSLATSKWKWNKKYGKLILPQQSTFNPSFLFSSYNLYARDFASIRSGHAQENVDCSTP